MNPSSRVWTLAVSLTVLAVTFAASPSAAQSPPTFQSAHFFGGGGDQEATAVAIRGLDLYVAGNVFPPGNAQGLLVKYAVPPSAPVWSAILLGGSSQSVFNGLALTSTTVYAVGAVVPPNCGAVDGVGSTEGKSLLARYTSAGALLGCQSTNFFLYTGGEFYQTAIATAEGGMDFIYAATERAEHCGFSTNPFVLVKYDASGLLLNRATEPGLSFGGFACSFGGSRATGLAELNGNIYLAGSSSLAGEPGVTISNGVAHPVLMKFDINLNRIWKALSTDSPAGVFNGVTAAGGSIYAVGNTYSPVFVGVPFFPTGVPGSRDFLIEKYDELGTRLWTVTSGGADDDVLTGVVGIGSRVFAVGYTRSSGAGGADAVILEINPATGATLSTTYFGGVQDDRANGMATDGSNLYVVGASRSFASAEGNAVGQNDLMLLRYTLNQPPVADAGADQMVECASPSGTPVTLDGSASSDPDLDTLSYEWRDADDNVIGTAASVFLTLDLGEYIFTLTVDDGNGGTASDSVSIHVVDTTPPTLTLSSSSVSVVVPTASATSVAVDVLAASGATANDLCDASPMLSHNGPAVFPIGTTIVTITATDDSGNYTQKQFTVQVMYNFIGFLPPIRNDGTSIFKSGRTIPIKFQLTAADGSFIADATATLSVFRLTDAILGTTEELTPDAAGASNTSNLFRFDPTSNQYIYNLQTTGYPAGTYVLRAALNDGTAHEVMVSIRQ